MRTIFLLFFLCVSIQAIGQNYRTASTTQVTYYDEIATSILFDNQNFPFSANSYSISNTDTLIYFLEVLKNESYFDSTLGYNCLDTASVPWQGERVLLQNNGIDVYYNQNNQSISINTQAVLGETWLMYDDAIRIEATITAVTFENILGIMDSVKTFTLQVFDINGNPITHSLNGKIYELSQSFGFVKAPAFYAFPMSNHSYEIKGIQKEEIGIYNIGRNDIYNFEVGDEFHIHEKLEVWGVIYEDFYKVLITSKSQDNDNNWQYDYTINHIQHYPNPNDESIIVTQDTTTIPDVLIPKDRELEPRVVLIDTLKGAGDSRIENSTYPNRIMKYYPYQLSAGDCWGLGGVYFVATPYYYHENLGGPYHQGAIDGVANLDIELAYFRRGSEEIGTPINFDYLLSTDGIQENDKINIFPNPVDNFLTIDLSAINFNQNYTITIINDLGQTVSTEALTNDIQKIPVYHLPKGIYTIQIKGENSIYNKRFMKQ